MAEPTFDFNGDPIKIVNETGTVTGLPKIASAPLPNLGSDKGNMGNISVDDMFMNGYNSLSSAKRMDSIGLNTLNYDPRYPYSFRGSDMEGMYAQQQSWTEKAFNGVVKGANLAATTIAGGFGMLYGTGKAIVSPEGKLSDIWDNEIMQGLDEWNTRVDQEFLPNYYTKSETDAEWYARDNWLSANFLFDKVIKNAGFAVGAMYSGNIANGALGTAGTLSGNAAIRLAGAAEASQAFKIFTPLLRNTARAFSSAKNIEVAQILEEGVSSIADVTAKSSKILQVSKQANMFGAINDYGRRTAIAAYSSAGEASFEALQTSNQFRENLIERYREENGTTPEGDDLEKINEISRQVGATSFLGNMALLTLTEFQQLPNLLGSSYRASKQAANSMLGKVDDVLLKEGKYVSTAPTASTKFGKLYDKAGKAISYIVDPKEGAQEIGQYALQVGTQNYFERAYQGKNADAWVDGFVYGLVGRDENDEGVGALVSKEGIEGGLIGGLIGGAMQSFGKGGTRAQDKATKSNTDKFVDSLNYAPSFREAFKDKLDYANRNLVTQQQHQDAVIAGDVLEANDLQADMMHSYMMPRIKYGRFDMVMDDIQELKRFGVSEEGLASLKEQGVANITDTIASYQERLTKFETTARNTENLNRSINLRFGGQSTQDIEGNSVKRYPQAVIDKMVYAASKIADYDLRIPEVSMGPLSKGIDIQSVIDNQLLEDSSTALATALATLDNDTKDITADETKQELKDVVEMSLRRQKFVNEYNDMKNNPENYNEFGDKNQYNEQGQKKRTTIPDSSNDQYSSKSRDKFAGDKRTYEDLLRQYGEGEQSKRDVLKAITASPYATTMEKELAAKFIEFTPQESKIILGDRSLTMAGVSQMGTDLNSAVSRINYEDNAFDYENGTLPVEHVILHEIGHDLTMYGYRNDTKFKNEVDTLFDAVKNHFKNDPDKYAQAGIIRSGEFYALKNPLEFITETLANRDFQRYLNTIPYKNTQRTVWDNFLDNLKTFFSRLFKIESTDTALDEAVGIVTNNMERLYKNTKERVAAIEREEEALAKNIEEITKEQDKLEKEAGTIAGAPTDTLPSIEQGSADKRKDASILFKSSTTASEGYEDPTESSPHIRRTREFLNNISDFDNRGKIRALLVTPKQLRALGLGAVIEQTYRRVPTEEELLDPETGLLLQIYVEQGRTQYYVNKNGERLSKVGTPVDIDQIVYQTMPTAELKDRARSGQEEAAATELEAYKLFRSNLFAVEANVKPIQYKISVSRGIPRETIVNGEKERNHVGNILIGEDLISTQQNLIVISDGSVAFKGQNIGVTAGVPVLKYGDTLQPLNNTKFTKESAENIYGVIRALSKELIENSKTGKGRKLNPRYTSYLKNILHWRSQGDVKTDNQIYINPINKTMNIGNKQYYLTNIDNNEAEIVEQLQNAYFSTNDTTLKKNFNDKFYELIIGKDGDIQDVEWDNYQTYLLSSQNPDGSARSINNTPLITSVAAPTEAIPYSYQQKYATLEDLEFPFIEVKQTPVPEVPVVETPVEPERATAFPTVGEYTLDGTTNNTYTFKAGEVKFAGVIHPNGTIEALVDNSDPETLATIEIVASDDAVMKAAVLPNSGLAPEDLIAFGLEERKRLVTEFMDKKISADLMILKKAQDAAPASIIEETPTAPVEETPVVKEKKPRKKRGSEDSNFRKIGEGQASRMTERDLEVFKEWHSNTVPWIPYRILENIIVTNDNIRAWGVFEDGIAKFVKGGLRGTEYHEIFEAIWADFLPTEEKNRLITEFREKSGQFTDRESGKKYNYDDPSISDNMVKERIADDFADYRVGKLPARSLSEAIRNFFKSIMDFFKGFVENRSRKDELFQAIEDGRFKYTVLSPKYKSYAPAYRAVEGLTEQETHEFVQDMTAQAAGIIYKGGRKEDLFNPSPINSGEIFEEIKQIYDDEGILDEIGEKAWLDLRKRTVQSLRTLGINFNEDDLVSINNEGITNRDYAPEPFTQDWKKSSSGAIKFSLGTLLQRKPKNQQGNDKLEYAGPVQNDYGLYSLANFSKVFAVLLDKLSNTNSLDKFTQNFVDLAETDSNYVAAFVRAGGTTDKYFDFDSFDRHDWRYFIQFYQVFTKQKPDAIIQYIKDNEVYSAPANLFTSIDSTKKEWIENIKAIANTQGGFVKFVRSKKMYVVNTKEIQEMKIKSTSDMIEFLNTLGIEFTQETYNGLKAEGRKNNFSERDQFVDAVSSIHKYLGQNSELMSVKEKTLGINGPLTRLAELYNKVQNPNMDPTYFGVEGQRVGSYGENNVPSILESEFNESENLEELFEKRPELTDVFSRNSAVLKKGGLFFDKNGKRIKQLKVKYIQGTSNQVTGKGNVTSSLNIGQRHVQEINQNLSGNYYILVPADSSTEWMLNLGNNITYDDIRTGRFGQKVNDIFTGYLMDEIELALDWKNRSTVDNVKRQAKELRFFNEILMEKDLTAINKMIAEDKPMADIDQYIQDNNESIDAAVRAFLENTVAETREMLIANSQIYANETDGFAWGLLDSNFAKSNEISTYNMSSEEVDNVLKFSNINYIINNIEMHKTIFGDPYQFKIKNKQLDETKRIKSFLSPRRKTFDSPELNTFLNQEYNEVDGMELQPGDPGYHEFKPYTNTFTAQDITVAGSLSNTIGAYAKTNEADAMSWLMDTTYREVKIKNGQWSDAAETWHQWQMAYTRQNMKGYKYNNPALEAHDKALVQTTPPSHVIEVLKPIVTGVKYNSLSTNLVLDKLSQMPVYFSMVEGTNMEKLYTQMMNQGYGYAIVESGRKVGAEGLHSLYNQDGSFNEEAFNNTIQVPWKAYGIQVETTTEGEKTQTRGSQITKMASMDLFENGIPTSEEARKEYIRNTELLDKMNENAYNNLLRKLGVEDLGGNFVLTDGTVISETLMYEMLRREVSDNTKDTIEIDQETNMFALPFEASPSYNQIRSILYSMINKSLISPTMSGGAHVQVPVTMFEKATEGRSLAVKTPEGWKKISKKDYETLSEEDKKKVVLTDDTLKFYTKEDPYCEIMLPHWFKDKFKNKFKSDEDLLKYLNSVEGGKILRGIGFRIPTQALSSAEAFRVKGFLPQYMGATVVVPSEITTKAGSDFDIDKLNMYLKSVYVDAAGAVRLISYKGSEQATKEFYGKVFDDKLQRKVLKKAELLETVDIIIHGLDDPKNLLQIYGDYVLSIQDQYDNPFDFVDILEKSIEELNDSNIQAHLRTESVNDMYKKALENEYYDSLEKLLTLPENFNRLISPVDDAGLEDMSKKLDELRGYDEGDIKGRLLNRNYMTQLRHSFVVGKKWVGIAAVNITSLSLRQKSQIFLDPGRFRNLSMNDARYIGDGKVNLAHNTVKIGNETYVSLSGTKTATPGKAQYISERLSGYATAFVDVAKNPFIMKIIQSDTVVGTFMFLESIGAGEQGIMFLNQPIIAEYLKMLDGRGTKGLFIQKNIDEIERRFPSTEKLIVDAQFGVDNFEKNISDFYQKGTLTPEQNAEQQLMLREFLKYAKMAQFAFKLTQATNYDTTRFSSGDAFTRKQWRTMNAREANIFSSVDKIMNNTFVGKLENFLDSSMEAMGAIMKLEQDQFRAFTDDILKVYAKNEFMSSDEFDRIGNKIRGSFLDYIILTKSGVNQRIKELLIDPETSVVAKLEKAKQDYPEVKILRELVPITSNRVDGTKTIALKVNLKDAYDENLYTGLMREMRDYNDELNALYQDIVALAILQGSYQTAISIKNIIPVEDYAAEVEPIITQLTASPDLNAFTDRMFNANNFKDDVIMPIFLPRMWDQNNQNPVGVDEREQEVYQYGNTDMIPNIPALDIKSSDRAVLLLSEKYNSRFLNNDYIKVPRIFKQGGEWIDFLTGKTVTGYQYSQRINTGDYTTTDVFGYEKVYLDVLDEKGNRIPLTTSDRKKEVSHVYKLINLYGDGFRAVEHYNDYKPSVIENGTFKIAREISNQELFEYFDSTVTGPVLNKLDMQPDNIQKVISGQKTITNRTVKLNSGEYAMPDGTPVTLTYIGEARTWDTMIHVTTPTGESLAWTKDDFAVGEGFEDWNDFVKNNKYSSNFINQKQSRFIFQINLSENIVPLPTAEEAELMDFTSRLEALTQAQQDMLDTDPALIVAQQMPKILPESARKETGTKVGTAKDINPNLLSKTGVSVEKASEILYANYFAENNMMSEAEIRDTIIDILQQGKNNFINERSGQDQINQLKVQISNLGQKPKQLNLFEQEDTDWKTEDNNDTCEPI